MSASKLINQVAQYQLFSEGGRAIYFHRSYLIYRISTQLHHPWHTPVGVIGNFRNDQGRWWLLIKDFSPFQEQLDLCLEDPDRLVRLKQFISDLRSQSVALLPSAADLKNMSADEVIRTVTTYYNNFEQVFAVTILLRMIDRAVIIRTRDLISDPQKADEVIRLLSISDKPSIARQEEHVLVEFAQEIVDKNLSWDSQEVKGGIEDILKKFCWSTCGYYNEPLRTYEDYLALLQGFVEQGPAQVKKQLQLKIDQELQERTYLLNELPDNVRQLEHIAAESGYLKDFMKFGSNEMVYRSEPLFAAIAELTGRSASELKNLMPEEVVALLKQEPIDEQLVKDRMVHCVTISIGDQLENIIGKEAADIEQTYFSVSQKTVKELRGRAASPGKAQGRVKIILGTKDFHKLEAGDILVGMNTSPDYVPIMKKAGAIVTEDGGITSHASLVSRELGVPAVVGIVGVTQLLKDGDMVEVDATKGVIKIL